MALWKDGSAPAILDLSRYENGIGAVVSTESIDLADKLLLARQEIGSALFRFLTDQGAGPAVTTDLPDVVVTEPLQRWVTFKALALAYREAHFSNLSERYKGKWTEYTQQAAQAKCDVFGLGVGRVNQPLPRPGVASVTQVSGDLQPNTYYVALSWVDSGGHESEASELVVCVTDAISAIAVSRPAAPIQISGWNVFVGLSDNALSLQNASPLLLNNSWTLPGSLQAGRSPGTGQQPDYYVRERRSLWRG